MATTASKSATWPTSDQITRVTNALYVGLNPLDEVLTDLNHLVDIFERELCDGAAAASEEEVGRLAMLVANLRSQQGVLAEYVRELEIKLDVAAMTGRPDGMRA